MEIIPFKTKHQLNSNMIIGISPFLDEEEVVRGWYANIETFCDVVLALVDPRCTDRTIPILEEIASKNPKLEILYQDIEFGDSTRSTKGRLGYITYLVEINRLLADTIPRNAWVVWVSADERLDASRKENIMSYLDQAQALGFDSVVFNLIDVYPDESHYINYDKAGLLLTHRKIFKNVPNLTWGMTAHTGVNGLINPLRIPENFYHFGFVKHTKQECWWRAVDGLHWLDKIPEDQRYLPIQLPFKDWRNEQ